MGRDSIAVTEVGWGGLPSGPGLAVRFGTQSDDGMLYSEGQVLGVVEVQKCQCIRQTGLVSQMAEWLLSSVSEACSRCLPRHNHATAPQPVKGDEQPEQGNGTHQGYICTTIGGRGYLIRQRSRRVWSWARIVSMVDRCAQRWRLSDPSIWFRWH
jgi:hypothetical protein